MEFCTSCGHELGLGRFCTTCGHPVEAPVEPPAPPVRSGAATGRATDQPADPDDWRTGTAERPAVRGPVPVPETRPVPTRRLPPALPSLPVRATSTPRFPLYADEVRPARGLSYGSRDDRRSARWLPWVVGVAALLLVGVSGVLLLLGDDPDPTRSLPPEGRGGDGAAASARPAAQPTQRPTQRPTQSPTRRPTPQATVPATPTGPPVDLTAASRARAPVTAAASGDFGGNRTTYGARNLLDGIRTTTWRMPGDGTGREIVITLPGPTVVTRVGLVNGYAKSAVGPNGGKLNWYTGNRRVLTARWIFDDGTSLLQHFTKTRDLQTRRVSDVPTRRIRLVLEAVSAPGPGRASRDYTAVSDVGILGAPL